MSPIQSKPERLGASRKRKVRIVGQPRLPRVATWSLVLALAAAILLPALWRLGRREEALEVRQRTLPEWETDWKCEAGHTFQSTGQIDPRSCWICGQPAYPVARYACPSHGLFEVQVQWARDGQGRVMVTERRVDKRPWVAAEKELRCPRCGALLNYVRDPLQGFNSREKEAIRRSSP